MAMHHPESDRSAYPAIPTVLALVGIVILLVALFVMDSAAQQDTGTGSGMMSQATATTL